MLVRFFIAILVLAGILLATALVLPSEVHVERSIIIERPPSVVYGLLNDYQHFTAWSPWAERDPNTRYTYTGPGHGVGSRMSWDGDPRQVGKGSQEIIASEPYSMIRVSLDFEDQGRAVSYFDIRPEGRGTRLEWGFDTDVTEGRDFVGAVLGKYFGLLFDRWVGADYEEGLERFKQYAETFPAADYAGLEIEEVTAEAQPILFVSTSSAQSDEAVARALGAAFAEISRFMAARGLERVGMPMSIIRSRNENGFQFDAAIPVARSNIDPPGNIKAGWSPSGEAIRVVHKGAYSSIAETYRKAASYMAVRGVGQGGVSWEHYITDPGSTPEDQLITHIYFLIEP